MRGECLRHFLLVWFFVLSELGWRSYLGDNLEGEARADIDALERFIFGMKDGNVTICIFFIRDHVWGIENDEGFINSQEWNSGNFCYFAIKE